MVTDKMVGAGLAYYSEGGCSGLAEYERREVVTAIIEAALSTVNAEPVAWVGDIGLIKLRNGASTTVDPDKNEDAWIALYATPQASAPVAVRELDATIDALAYRFWSIHQKELDPYRESMPDGYKGGVRAWFFAVEMRKLLAARSALVEVGEAEPVTWRDMSSAPKDGTFVRLLVRPGSSETDGWTPFADSSDPYQTIGFNALSDTTEDVWQFAGWDWCHDCFTDGAGEVIGWLPFVPELVEGGEAFPQPEDAG